MVTELLGHWDNFYVIIGSSAAALTGLQFVVVVLAAEMDAVTRNASRSFATPTIVHFCAVLLISAILTAPWEALWPASWLLTICGVIGIGYIAYIVRHARRQSDYKPVLEDWIFHFVTPFVSYVALVISALAIPSAPRPALFGTAASVLLLLFSGIHNAWDSVIWIATEHRERQKHS